MQAGLNLYSIRNLISTEEDFLATAKRLREMGYSYLQFSGAPYDAEMIRRVSEASGLPVVLTHVPYDRIVGDTEALAREHLSFGCHRIGLGALPLDKLGDEAALEYGVKVTGATVHFVNEIADGGEIIMQKAVAIRENDTPETLQKRVMRLAEWKILPAATELVCSNIIERK